MLGDRLMELRKKHGYSQQEIADILSVSRQTISNWESGQGAPALDKACELARIYKISLDELVGNEVRGVAEKQKEIPGDWSLGISNRFRLFPLVGQGVGPILETIQKTTP